MKVKWGGGSDLLSGHPIEDVDQMSAHMHRTNTHTNTESLSSDPNLPVNTVSLSVMSVCLQPVEGDSSNNWNK